MKYDLTIAAEILQKHPVFVLDNLTLSARDGLEQIFADVSLLDDVVALRLPKREALGLQRDSKCNLCFENWTHCKES